MLNGWVNIDLPRYEEIHTSKNVVGVARMRQQRASKDGGDHASENSDHD